MPKAKKKNTARHKSAPYQARGVTLAALKEELLIPLSEPKEKLRELLERQIDCIQITANRLTMHTLASVRPNNPGAATLSKARTLGDVAVRASKQRADMHAKNVFLFPPSDRLPKGEPMSTDEWLTKFDFSGSGRKEDHGARTPSDNPQRSSH